MTKWIVLPLLILASTVSAQEKSINPGINESFQNPNVEEFVDRFERDGRDAFDHRHEVLKACRIKPGMAIADIGAGTGLFSRMFAKAVGPKGTVYAVDIAEKFVKHIERSAEADGIKNIVGVVCSADSVKLPANSIDLAYICDTYHHFEFPHKTMRSIHRALKPGGQVVLIDFHRIEGKSSEWILGHVRAGQEVFTKEIVKAGFRQVEEKRGLLDESYFVRFEKLEEPKEQGVLFREGFDDSMLLQRGWYDGDRFRISMESPRAGAGCLEYEWKDRGTTPASSSGIRRLFEPSETVYLRCYLKLSKDFGWTGRNYHPHLMHFLTIENGKYHGPAASHLTLYIEPMNGKLRLAAQDIQNKDQPHGLTQGPLRGGYNGRFYDSEAVLFNDDKWHCVEALFQLNTLNLKKDKPNADGIVRGWFDGKLVVDRNDVVLRSMDFPNMKFNQFLLTPYFGPGLLPHAQTLWIDELVVGTERLESTKKTSRNEAGESRKAN